MLPCVFRGAVFMYGTVDRIVREESDANGGLFILEAL